MAVIISISELEDNLDKYIAISQKEDVFIRKNGKVIVKLVAVRNQADCPQGSLNGGNPRSR